MTSRRRFATLLGLALVLAAPAARGQVVVNFNDLGYPNGSFDPGSSFPAGPAPAVPGGTDSYDNGWDFKGGVNTGGVIANTFTSNGVVFTNSYDINFNSWAGWGYSNVNDPTKTGPIPNLTDYTHQFAAIAGTAPLGGLNYGIDFDSHTIPGTFISDGAPYSFVNLPSGTSPVSMLVTNSTYTYLSMVDGDGAGKQFGVGDYFQLQIYGYTGPNGTGAMVNGGNPVDFYLANYTSANSTPVNVWSPVDLTALAGAQSLGFGFASSDTGQFGINTPLYFAMDDLTLGTSAVPEPSSAMLALAGLGFAGLSAARRRRRPAAAR